MKFTSLPTDIDPIARSGGVQKLCKRNTVYMQIYRSRTEQLHFSLQISTSEF